MVFVLLALTLMAVDNRNPQALQPIRTVATMMVYPLLKAVDFPQSVYKHASSFVTKQVLLSNDNRVLNQQVQLYAAQQQDMDSLRQENERLRGLLNGVPHEDYSFSMAETVEAANDRIRGLVILNKGSRDGVHEGQVVLAGNYIYGQITAVTPFSSTVMQLVDRGHSIPVRNQRTGERGLANGLGRGMALEIKNLTATSEVQDGDIYVSSGLGGLFPPDFPVAKVIMKQGDSKEGEAVATVKAIPLVNYDAVREVLLVWKKPGAVSKVTVPAKSSDIPPSPAHKTAASKTTEKITEKTTEKTNESNQNTVQGKKTNAD